MYRSVIVILFSILFLAVSSDSEAWEVETNSLWNFDVEVDGDNLWCATRGGVVKWNLSDMSYKKMTSEDGLQSNDIWNIEIDSEGRVWVLSQPYGKLNMFDGQSWRTYSSEDGLTAHSVRDIACGKNGNVFVQTSDGFFRFNGDRWLLFTQKNGYIDDRVTLWEIGRPGLRTKICKFFSTENGDILFDGAEGLVRYDGTDFNVLIPKEMMTMNVMDSIVINENDGTIWFVTSQKIYKYQDSVYTEFTSEDGITEGTKTLKLDDDGNIWIGVRSHKERPCLFKYDGETWESYSTKEGLPSRTVYALDMDKNGNLWIVTNEGLCGFDGVNFQTYLLENEVADSYIKALTTCGGYVWVGTNKGVSRFDGFSWETYTTENGLSSNNVNALLGTQDKNIWVATATALFRFDGDSWKTALPGTFISIASDEDDVVWAGTKYGGIYSINGENIRHYTDDLLKVEVTCLDAAKDGKIWAGTGKPNIYLFENEHWSNFEIPHELRWGGILTLEPDDNGGVWVGTHSDGVFHFDGKNWTDEHLMKNDGIFSIETGPKGNLWFGGYSGLTRYDGVSLLSSYNDQGIVGGYVKDIAFNGEDEVWLNRSSTIEYSNISDIIMEPTFVEKSNAVPHEFELNGIYPNPFNPATSISYNVFTTGMISISIYNISGQKIRELFSGKRNAGLYSATWDGKDNNGDSVSAGVYLIKISSGHTIVTGKALYLK